MKTKYAYALVAIAAFCIFILPGMAQSMGDNPGIDDHPKSNDFDKAFSDGSFDWMMLLDQATLDKLKTMSPEEIDKLKHDMLERLRGLSPDELDRLRNSHMNDFRDRFKPLPPDDFENLKFPWQEDKNKIDDHKPIDVKTYGYDPFKSNKISDNKPDKDTPDQEHTKNMPYNAIPLNNSKIDDHNSAISGNHVFDNPNQFSQYQANMPIAGGNSFNAPPAGQPGPR
jgi:hypothetical protein